MEQQSQQPIQEKTENKPPIKTNWKFIAIVVALAVLVGGGAVFILLQILQPQSQLLPKYPKQYILQILPQDQSCIVDSDCVIVGTECGGCECGAPINKINQAKYERQYEELCRDYRGGFCDFLCQTPFIRCVHNKCTLSSVSSKTDLIKDWQTYRNDEFAFEVRYPAGWIVEENYGSSEIWNLVRIVNQNSVLDSFSILISKESVDENYNVEEASRDFSALAQETERFTLSDVPAVRMAQHSGILVIVLKDSREYRIYSLGDIEAFPEKSQMFNQILSTFRFRK